MELVPIIYTILKIVAALTILALTFSYISFKIRQNNEGGFSERQKAGLKRERANSLVKPIPEKFSRPAGSEKIIEEKAKQNEKQKKIPREKPHAEVSEIKKPMLLKKRLEVLKNLSNKTELHSEEKSEVQSSKRTKEKLNSLGNDILDKYIEEEKQDMFTLKVKEKKNKS